MVTGVPGSICSFRGLFFFFFMMLPMMFLLCTYLNFSIIPACVKVKINCYEQYRRSRKSRSIAIRKVDFLNVQFTFDFIPEGVALHTFSLFYSKR